jgi:PPE-repeat protein
MTTRKHVFYGILALVSLLGLGITQSARANFIATIDQVGTDVVVTGSGTIDLTGLSFLFGGIATPGISPNTGSLSVGPSASVDAYSGISGPASFDSGGFTFANGGSGDVVGVQGLLLLVPQGYVSGNPLSGTATYDNATFASLGDNSRNLYLDLGNPGCTRTASRFKSDPPAYRTRGRLLAYYL